MMQRKCRNLGKCLVRNNLTTIKLVLAIFKKVKSICCFRRSYLTIARCLNINIPGHCDSYYDVRCTILKHSMKTASYNRA